MIFFRAIPVLIIFIGILPMILGLPFYKVFSWESFFSRTFFSYIIGFFISFALFEFICLPMTYAGCSFSSFVSIYTIALTVCAIIAGIFFWKQTRKGRNDNSHIVRLPQNLLGKLRSITVFEMIYLILFLVMLGYQIYGAIRYSTTYSSMDDAEYIVYATDAVDNNRMFCINTQCGVFSVLRVKRTFQTSLLYYGYIAKLTGLSVTVVAHTVCCVLFVIVAYMVYWIMAEDIFEKRENRYIFLFLLALIFMFGNYSNYSLTFRLLGPNWQGKAILAVIEVPLLFVILHKLLDETYKHVYGFFLLILSVSAVSLSLMGVGTLLFVMSSIMILGAVLKKNPKLLFYILWGGFFPALVGGLYLLQNK